jgi:exodeoxyribonuclease VII large subunit
VYEPRGEYQLIVDSLQEAGEGLLQRRFEELKRKLEAEGLFEPSRKRALPAFPRRVAIVTSPAGAAVRDLIHVFDRRWPVAEIRVYPVRVQGAEAPAEISRAIAAANRHGWAELLIVGRGGGSLEDLMAFNDEAVARSVAASKLPVISAVGHETDFSICDFVADLRAPTPSAAAELATPDRQALIRSVQRLRRQLTHRLGNRLQQASQRLDHAAHRLRQRHPAVRLAEQSRTVQAAAASLARGMRRVLDQRSLRLELAASRLADRHPARRVTELNSRIQSLARTLRLQARRVVGDRQRRLADLARTLHAVSPLETVARGYAVLLDGSGGRVISRAASVAVGDQVAAQLADGRLHCAVVSVGDERLDSEQSEAPESDD